ncbi:hypothetical protein ScPMuIL_011193 [Solemya velum]
MVIAALCLVFLWSNGGLSEVQEEFKLPIGTIFNGDDEQAQSALMFRVKQLNAKQGRAFTLNVTINVTNVEDNFKLASSICEQMYEGVVVFLGKKDVKSLDIIQSFTRTFHMPYLSPSLSEDTAQHGNDSFEIHMKPPHTQAIIDIIRHFGWTRVHYLYDSDEGLHRLEHIYKEVRGGQVVSFKFRRIPDVFNAHEDLRKLDKMETDKPKLVVLDMSSDAAYKSILKQIPEVGMNRHGYHYLIAGLDILSVNLRRYLHGGVNVTGFQLVDVENSTVRDFVSKFRSANRRKYPGSRRKLHSETAMIVDSVGLVWRIFKMMLQADPKVFQHAFRRGRIYNYNKTKGIPCTTKPPVPWMFGASIVSAMKKVKFDGLTGHIAFDEKGLRHNYTLGVYNLGLEKTITKTGIWSPKLGYRSTATEAEGKNKTVVHREVKVITGILSQPFLMEREMTNGSPPMGNERYEGYVYDLAEHVGAIMKFEYVIRVVEDKNYGRRNKETGKWDGMMAELVEHRADMAIADLTITWDREKDVDFTKPFMNFGISIMIKKPEKVKPGVFSFMEPVSLNVWICIIFGYLSVSIGLFLVSRCSPYEWRKVSKSANLENEFSLLNSFWFSMGALMLQGNDLSPRSISGRIIGTVWWFFVLIIISSYTANLAAFLTIERLLMPIDEAEDLVKQSEIKYGTVASGSTRSFFENSREPVYAEIYEVMSSTKPSVFVQSTAEGINRVRKSKGKYAFFLESPANEYQNNRRPCDTMSVGGTLNSKGFGIATPENSPIRDALNLAVLELIEKGTLHKLRTTWWKDKGQCNADSDGSKKRSLSLSNVAGVFYILVGGLVISVILGSSEVLCKKSKLFTRPETYMKGTETAVTLIGSSFERENGTIGEGPPNYPPLDKNTTGVSIGPIDSKLP